MMRVFNLLKDGRFPSSPNYDDLNVLNKQEVVAASVLIRIKPPEIATDKVEVSYYK